LHRVKVEPNFTAIVVIAPLIRWSPTSRRWSLPSWCSRAWVGSSIRPSISSPSRCRYCS